MSQFILILLATPENRKRIHLPRYGLHKTKELSVSREFGNIVFVSDVKNERGNGFLEILGGDKTLYFQGGGNFFQGREPTMEDTMYFV